MLQDRYLRVVCGLLVLFLGITLLTKEGLAQSRAASRSETEMGRIAREVRHELFTLPWYGVFDWLEGSVSSDGTVTLRGWVVQPTTKAEAEARVKGIEGVEQLNSEIKVLPLSPNDDRLRRAIYASLFSSNSSLFRYALGANPSIHIIVEHGRVTLKGVVTSKADHSVANVKARSVSGVFEVRNELVVDGS